MRPRHCHSLFQQGARRADVTEASKGYASMGGTFKLTFQGYSTNSISYNADAADIQVGTCAGPNKAASVLRTKCLKFIRHPLRGNFGVRHRSS